MWREHLWPLLAGTVIAVGLAGAASAYGAVGLLLGFAILSPFAVVVFWGLSEELGIDRSSAVRRGLGDGTRRAGPAWLVRALPSLRSGHRSGGRAQFAHGLGWSSDSGVGWGDVLQRADLVDPILLDRRFDDIVSQLRQSGDLPES